MKPNNLLSAFINGKNCRKQGYSEDYNPFRNETHSNLFDYWLEGWKEEDKLESEKPS